MFYQLHSDRHGHETSYGVEFAQLSVLGETMPKIRKINRIPTGSKNFYVVDANFLANKYIQPYFAPNDRHKARIEQCLDWWEEIDEQIWDYKARVYIPDICIAETFKVLAKKYYMEKWFTTSTDLNNARSRLIRDITTPPQALRRKDRFIEYHDISTSRDIIISVDRFFEVFMKYNLEVSLPDLIILATAKYLIDFFDLPKRFLHIVTLDRNLRTGSIQIQEIPNAYDPTLASDSRDIVFFTPG